MKNKDLQDILKKFPDDLKIVIGIECDNQLVIYYDTVCGGLNTGDEKIIYISSESMGEELTQRTVC